jgi:chorismate synthase
MVQWRWSTAGESHGEALLAVIEGVPFGLELDVERIDRELARRQLGFGRSARQRLEQDRVEIVAGAYHGRASGAPLVLRVRNKDQSLSTLPPLHRPRPGHADLAGAFKYDTNDARPVLERASARETVARVAAGAVAKMVLQRVGIRVEGFVTAIGPVLLTASPPDGLDWLVQRDASPVWCPDTSTSAAMCEVIRSAGANGDTLGGVVEVRAFGVPPGLGSLMRASSRLDARLAAAVMSVPSVKALELGDGIASATRSGHDVHDSIGFRPESGQLVRGSNRAGGVEGGMSNGQPLVVRAYLKPLATTKRALDSVDLRDGATAPSDPQRSDVCAVPSGAVVIEHVVGLVVLESLLDAVPADTIEDLDEGFRRWSERRRGLPGS